MSPATRYRPRADAAWSRRALVNTLNLTTPLGLAVAKLGGARVRRGPRGLWLGEGYRLRLPVAGAFTVGNVVTTPRTFDDLTALAPDVLGHEDRHAWQYYRLGLLFFPAYGAASSWSWVRYGNPAIGNHFERQAGLVSGCYVASGHSQPSPRPLGDAVAACVGVLGQQGSKGGKGLALLLGLRRRPRS